MSDIIKPTVADIEAAMIPATVQSIEARGYYAAGDGGGALYRRTTAGSGIGKIQSADGAWWIVAPQPFYTPLQFGAKGDGTTDDTIPLNHALTFATGGKVVLPSGFEFVVTGNVSVPAGTVLEGSGSGSAILCATDDVSPVEIVGDGAVCRSFRVTFSNTGGTMLIGGVLVAADLAIIDGIEVSGSQWAGVFLDNASNCIVMNCYFHDFLQINPDGSDIVVYNNSQYNNIYDNICSGGNWHGILVQDPSGDTQPLYNHIGPNNVIKGHLCYGIAIYTINGIDLFAEVFNNQIQDIQGTVLDGASGAGIYILGAGGCVVSGNRIENCCVYTTTQTLAPAGIGVSTIVASLKPVTVCSNRVTKMANFYDIFVVSSPAGAIVEGNVTVTGSAASCAGIVILDCVGVVVSGNIVCQDPTIATQCIAVLSNGTGCSSINITNNIINGGNRSCIETILLAGAVGFSSMVISGNTNSNPGVAMRPLNLDAVSDASVVGNVFLGGTCAPAVFTIQDCAAVTFSGNRFKAQNSIAFESGGACTGTQIDKSNLISGEIINGASGVVLEQYLST